MGSRLVTLATHVLGTALRAVRPPLHPVRRDQVPVLISVQRLWVSPSVADGLTFWLVM